jgi:hypothetical protein
MDILIVRAKPVSSVTLTLSVGSMLLQHHHMAGVEVMTMRLNAARVVDLSDDQTSALSLQSGLVLSGAALSAGTKRRKT